MHSPITTTPRLVSTRRRWLIAGICLALTCAGFALVGGATAAKAKPALVFAAPGNFTATLADPCKQGNGPGQTILTFAYAPLIHWKPNGQLVPALATSWRYIKDPGGANKGFEVNLRHDARFSDGSPLTAQAVKGWWQHCQAVNSPLASSIGPIRSIETVGKYTVRLRVKSPNPILPYALSDGYTWGLIASPKAVANPKLLGTQTFGAGPYVLDPKQSVSSDHATLVPNKYFYDQSGIKFGKVTVRTLEAPTTILQAVKTGQVDVAWGDFTTAAAAESSGLGVVYGAAGSDGMYFLDLEGSIQKALADVRVRQAMNYAVDRKAITQALFGKYGVPTSEPFTIDGRDPAVQNYYAYDPEKAKSLLRSAGYADGFTLKINDATFAGNFIGPLNAAICKYLAAVAIKCDLTTDNTNWFANLSSGKFSAGTSPIVGYPMWAMYSLFLGPKSAGAFFNQHTFVDATLEKLWIKGSRARASEAGPIWKEMTRRMVTQAYFLNVAYVPWIYYVSKRVGGVVQSPDEPGAALPAEWFPK
jgi:peptide/nickel transport system substrate-binding protein